MDSLDNMRNQPALRLIRRPRRRGSQERTRSVGELAQCAEELRSIPPNVFGPPKSSHKLKGPQQKRVSKELGLRQDEHGKAKIKTCPSRQHKQVGRPQSPRGARGSAACITSIASREPRRSRRNVSNLSAIHTHRIRVRNFLSRIFFSEGDLIEIWQLDTVGY